MTSRSPNGKRIPQDSKPRGCGVRRLVPYPERPIQRVVTCDKKAHGWESAEPIVGDSPITEGVNVYIVQIAVSNALAVRMRGRAKVEES